jgi:histidine decarboxylase
MMKPFISTARPIPIGYPCALNRNYSRVIPTLRHNYNNAGDAFAPEGTFDRHRHADERKLIERVADLWDVDMDKSWGYTTASGSEGNMQGLWQARELYPDGILYYSDQVHYSIPKIAGLLRMKSVVVPTYHTGAMDVRRLECVIDPQKPVIVLANIGSTFLGGVDDIEKIQHIVGGFTSRYYIHGDAAFWGFVMPYIREGYTYKSLDSISVSAHKWPGIPFPGGVFMCIRDSLAGVDNYQEVIAQRNVTISGSRNGHTAIFLNEFFDTVDLKEDVEYCMDATDYIFYRLQECLPEINLWKNTRSNIIVFDSPSRDLIKKWSLATVGKRSHVVVLPHVTKLVADAFIKDMSKHFERRSKS